MSKLMMLKLKKWGLFCAAMGAALCCNADEAVLVQRGDIVLTRTDFEAALSVIPKEKRETMSSSLKQTMIFLENVMIYRKLAQEGQEIGLDKDPVIQQEMRQAADRVLGQRRLDAFEAGLKFPDFTAAARERYVTRKAEFLVPEAVRASHILVSIQGRSDEAARARAEEVRKKALAGDDFSMLVKEYSDDPSKENNGGDLGFFGRNKMAKPFEDTAFALSKPGEISPVIQTQFGYHVIRLTEKRPEQQKPFDEVKGGMIKDLRDKFISDAKASHIATIKNDKSIVIHEDAIEAMFKK